MRFVFLVAVLAAIPPQAPDVEDAPAQAPAIEEVAATVQAPAMADPRWLSPEPMPEGAEWFAGTKYTQSVFTLGNERVIRKVPREALEEKWQVSGGMEGLTGWRSDKFRTMPYGKYADYGKEFIQVENGYVRENGSRITQPELAIVRRYPDGARFDDILSTENGVFEHRVRTKENGRWRSDVIYEDADARPEGYNGLSVSCASCHKQAGTGSYDRGLIPGGDTVISEPLSWDVLDARP